MRSCGAKQNTLFLCIVWWCWWLRNNTILYNDTLNSFSVCNNIMSFVQVCSKVFEDQDSGLPRTLRLVSWCKLSKDFLKVNTDSSSFGNPKRIGRGRLVHDEDGNQITSFLKHIDLVTNMYVELASVCHGLFIVKELGAAFFILEIGSLEALHLISKGDTTSHTFGMFIDDIRKFLNDNTSYHITHVLKEANQFNFFIRIQFFCFLVFICLPKKNQSG